MSIKLFVDDWREPPEGWQPARTITEAIRILATTDVGEVSLDHDILVEQRQKIGRKERIVKLIGIETFEPVAYYIKALNESSRRAGGSREEQIRVYCHSGNPLAYEKYSHILGEPMVSLFYGT